MKKIVVTFSLFFITAISFSQSTYFPFPTDSAYWRVDWSDNSNTCTASTGVFASYQYVMNGDTTIGGSTYKKILKNGVLYNGCYQGTPFGYQGAMREDTILKKVFFIPNGNTTDTLLYDFNLVSGDTVNSFLQPISCSPLIISSVNSILIGNYYRKKWNLNLNGCNSSIFLIEGIGHSGGLIESYMSFEFGGNLICYNDHSTTLYPAGTTQCSLISSTHEIKGSS